MGKGRGIKIRDIIPEGVESKQKVVCRVHDIVCWAHDQNMNSFFPSKDEDTVEFRVAIIGVDPSCSILVRKSMDMVTFNFVMIRCRTEDRIHGNVRETLDSKFYGQAKEFDSLRVLHDVLGVLLLPTLTSTTF